VSPSVHSYNDMTPLSIDINVLDLKKNDHLLINGLFY
jgi:hypothetical protein